MIVDVSVVSVGSDSVNELRAEDGSSGTEMVVVDSLCPNVLIEASF